MMERHVGFLQSIVEHKKIERITLSRECVEQAKHIQSKTISDVIFHDSANDTNCFLPIECIVEIFFKHNQTVVNKALPFLCNADKENQSVSCGRSLTIGSSLESLENIQSFSSLTKSSSENNLDNNGYHELVADQFYWHGKCQQEMAEYFSKLDLKRNVITCHVMKPEDQLNYYGKTFKTVKQNRRKFAISDTNYPKCLNNISKEDKSIYKNALKCVLLPLPFNADEFCELSPVPLIRRKDSYCIDFTSIDRSEVAGKLQRAFQSNLYLKDIIETELSNSFSECPESQMLAEDIYNQKQVLISNASKFYNHDDPYYEEWKQLQLNWIDKIINSHQLCAPSTEKFLNTTNYHEEFKILVEKLLNRDLNNEQEDVSENRRTAQALTTTSQKILREFGLRFGVGKVFIKIAIFSTMVKHCFAVTDYYLYCLDDCLKNAVLFLEERNDCYFLKEKRMMEDALEVLHQKLEYCFFKILNLYNLIKKSFDKNLSEDGFSVLVELLKNTINAKYYFKMWEPDDNCDTQSLLAKYMKVTMENFYSNKKSKFVLKHSHKMSNPSQLVSYLLKKIKRCLKKVQDIFKIERSDMYNSLHRVVANTLYNELMRDVQAFFKQNDFKKPVDQDILHLVYCLNKLDREWNGLINRSAQTWRDLLKEWLPDIIENIFFNIHSLIQIFIKKDSYSILQFTEKVKSSQPTQNTNSNLFNHDPTLSPFASIEQFNEDRQEIIVTKAKNSDRNVESDAVSYNNAFYSFLDNLGDDLIAEHLLNELVDQIVDNFHSSSSYVSEGPCIEEQNYERPGFQCIKMPKKSQENTHHDINENTHSDITNEVLIVSEKKNSCVEKKIHNTFQTIEDLNINHESVNKKHLNMLQNGLSLVTSSFSDLLSCCFELIEFAKKVFFTIHPPSDLLEFENILLSRKLCLMIRLILEKYASSLLLLDICGVKNLNETTDRKLKYNVGKEFLADLGELRKSLGCRHSVSITDQSIDCNGILDTCIILQNLFEKSGKILEPITRQMCYRINNIYSLLCILHIIQKELADSFDVSLDDLQEPKNKIKIDDYCNKGPCKTPIKDQSKLCLELMNCKKHLDQVLKVQLMLIVSRVEEIFCCLFNENTWCSENLTNRNMCLLFLSDQLNMLKHNLYHACLQSFVVKLFERIEKFFHDVLNKILLTKSKTMQIKIGNLELMLKEIVKILKQIDGDSYPNILNQQVIIMFRFKILLYPIDEMRQIFQTMYQTTGYLQDVILESLLTYEEVILNLRHSLPKKFTGQEFIEKLRSNMEWYNVLCRQNDENNDEYCKSPTDFDFRIIGQSFLIKGIIVTVQSEPVRLIRPEPATQTAINRSSFDSPSFSSESLLSAEECKFNNEPTFSQTFIYKFTSKNMQSISKIYFNGALYRIAREQKFRIDVFMDDMLKLFLNYSKYKKNLELKFFIEQYSKSATKTGCFNFMKVISCGSS